MKTYFRLCLNPPYARGLLGPVIPVQGAKRTEGRPCLARWRDELTWVLDLLEDVSDGGGVECGVCK